MRTRRLASRLSTSIWTLFRPSIRKIDIRLIKVDHFRRLQLENTQDTSRHREKSQLEQYFSHIRPAILPYYVGTDICHIPRIERILYSDKTSLPSKPKGKMESKPDVNYRFLERLFNEYELEYIQRTRQLGLTQSQKQRFTTYVAGRWAAKEAIIKSAPPGRKLTLQDVMVITFSRTEAQKPRGIILTTKCAANFEAIRNYNRSCLSETASMLADIKKNSISRHASKESLEDGGKRRISGHDIDGQEVRLSISHDGVYATAVAIAQLDNCGTIAMESSKETEFEMNREELQLVQTSRRFDRHNHDEHAFKRLDLRKQGEKGQAANNLSGPVH